MLFAIIYLIIILLIWFFNRDNDFLSVFRSTKKTNWIVSGLSLFMLYTATNTMQLYSGIIFNKGIWGLWLLWANLIPVAVVPIVFAPLWAKLNFITDNQFILYRFSGIGAKILHQFRAVYVGGIVVAFILSFQTIAFSRILEVYFNISQYNSILITGGILSLFALKNSFSNRFKTDIFHSFLFFLSIIISLYFLFKNTGGLSNVINHIKRISPDTLSIFPPESQHYFWYSIAIYFGVQWWSSGMFDGGGSAMSRYTATGTRKGAIKAGLTPVLLNIFLILILIVMSLMSFANNNQHADGELAIIETIFSVIPGKFSMLVLIGFFAIFITTAESTLNWGASFLVVDFYKGYLVKNKNNRHYTRISFIVMFFLSLVSVVIALNINSLELLIKILLSISAGVAPVFILRWFWMRINAWSQISAMLSSGIYTMLFIAFQYYHPHFFDNTILHAYECRIIVVTILTTVTWLIVTFLTAKDSKEITDRFVKILPSKNEILKSFGIAFLIGILLILFLVLLLILIIH